MLEPITGTTEECLRHYFDCVPDAREHLGRFTGAASGTPHVWSTGKMPGGVYLLSVMYFLDALGYQIEEVKHTPETIRGLARVVAFRQRDAKDVAEALGYTGGHPANTLLNVLLQRGGLRNVDGDKERAMEKIILENQAEVDAKAEALRQMHQKAKLRVVGDASPRPAYNLPVPPLALQQDLGDVETPSPAVGPSGLADLLERTSNQIDDLMLALESIAGHPEGLRLLRMLVGSYRFEELKKYL